MERFSAARNLAKALLLAAEYGTPAERLSIGRDLLRLGNRVTTGGVYIDVLIGRSIHSMAIDLLAQDRRNMSADDCRMLIQELQAIEDSRESDELIATRDAIYCARLLGWTARVAFVANQISQTQVENPLADSWQQSHALLRLLEAELALQAYRCDHGVWPDSLADLAPRYLPAVPLDPYVDRPLIYRKTGESYLLYSVGKNGIDDGAAFVGFLAMNSGTPADLWVDIYAFEREQEAKMAPALEPAGTPFEKLGLE